MADQNAELWPIAKYHFLCEIDGEVISFQEVSGLDQETEVLEYRHGDSPVFSKIKLPGMMKFSNVTFKKGVFDGDSRLTEMFSALYEKDYYSGERWDIVIQLLNEKGDPMMSWKLIRAFPVKLTGTDLKSEGNEIAIESLEIAHEGITTEVE